VPVILMSDATHLTNFSGDKKSWPIYMTIGNIKRSTRTKPSTYSTVLLALLPVPFKLKALGHKARAAQVSRNREVLQEVLQQVLEPLHDAGRLGKDAKCSDKHQRRCFPRLAGWIADYPEQCDIAGVNGNCCPWCECPASDFGQLESEYPVRDFRNYSAC
jgi:hypothetical protein